MFSRRLPEAANAYRIYEPLADVGRFAHEAKGDVGILACLSDAFYHLGVSAQGSSDMRRTHRASPQPARVRASPAERVGQGTPAPPLVTSSYSFVPVRSSPCVEGSEE